MSRILGGGRLLFFLAMLAGATDVGAQTSDFRDVLRRNVEERRFSFAPARLSVGKSDANDVLALEYTVLLHKEGKDSPVDEAVHEFHQGDQIRVRINPLTDMYVYIFYERAGGQRLCLQPISKESPPLARRNQAFELPADGSVYEFDAPQGEEKLLVVATAQPSEDLAALADMVCRKKEEKLTAEEKQRRKELRARSQKILQSLRDEQRRSVQYRGVLSDQALAKVGEELRRQGALQAILQEPPHDKQTGTFCAAASFDAANQPELFVTITLRSVPLTTSKP